ncbi:putative MATE family efflux protein [Rubricella aquisinus]|uniref:Multidrug export protein MepA n=1 Tax=Rubricella aquisinus TaxID=2028108 RepID=A0A840WX99_9RHOB|nr:MATE family efflux transporter [Rubricella aquisinus]MBB5514974.1 putative MATE family efflux protein [Rubricella aquisinus]
MSLQDDNTFIHGPLGPIYAKTALPIIFVMGMNGVLAVVDALFLGWFVGPDALAAVTLMFPLYMLVVSLATLVSSGMSSILARDLGAGQVGAAARTFAAAHGLALTLGLILIGLFLLFGEALAFQAAGGDADLARMGVIYLQITILFSPLLFVLSVNSDALRNEGRVGLMAAMSLLVSFSNIGFNYVLIAMLDMGVAGSAYGTALAQALAFVIILGIRFGGRTVLTPGMVIRNSLLRGWRPILALGAPQSLGFVGLALGSAAILAMLQIVDVPHYEATVSAYGVTTRIMTFVYLPLLGLSFAMQTITGNNYGAGHWARSDQSLRIAAGVGLVYCLIVQVGATLFAAPIGAAFVDDPAVIAEVARILPIMVMVFVLSGPLMMIATHFQAIGDAGRAAVLSLTRTYGFAIPLTFTLPFVVGEVGIWLAGPVAEVMVLVLTIIVLMRSARRNALRWGLFKSEGGVPA